MRWVQAQWLKRIVITVGEKNRQNASDLRQDASVELVVMFMLGAAYIFGLPVSTKHVLSSGVAGTMEASKSGLQMSTNHNLLTARTQTLSMAMLLSGLYWLSLTYSKYQ